MDPDVDADFYSLEQLLDDDGLRRVMAVREFMEKSVAPVIDHYWIREKFPTDLGTREINTLIVGRAITGLGAFV
jgi:glutaryl-CoA dehydrogenase